MQTHERGRGRTGCKGVAVAQAGQRGDPSGSANDALRLGCVFVHTMGELSGRDGLLLGDGPHTDRSTVLLSVHARQRTRMGTHPLSPPLKKVVSSIMATQSTLPSTNLTSPRALLRFPPTSSSIPSSSIAPSRTFLIRLATPPRKTN
jgi:hypothetical protein